MLKMSLFSIEIWRRRKLHVFLGKISVMIIYQEFFFLIIEFRKLQ